MPPEWLAWTPDQTETLRSMWLAGATGTEIGDKLGTSRSAIMGKIRRLGLIRSPIRHAPKRPKKLGKPAPKFPFMARVVRKPAPPKPAGPVHFRDLKDHHCRWIPGQPESQVYCGETRVHGSSWCIKHFRAAYSRLSASVLRPETRAPGAA